MTQINDPAADRRAAVTAARNALGGVVLDDMAETIEQMDPAVRYHPDIAPFLNSLQSAIVGLALPPEPFEFMAPPETDPPEED